jgi:hypothetical protein
VLLHTPQYSVPGTIPPGLLLLLLLLRVRWQLWHTCWLGIGLAHDIPYLAHGGRDLARGLISHQQDRLPLRHCSLLLLLLLLLCGAQCTRLHVLLLLLVVV